MQRVQFERAEVRGPGERGGFLEEAILDASDVDGRDPIGRALGTVALIEPPAVDSVGPAPERDRVAREMWEEHGRDRAVPIEEIALGEADLRPEWFVEARYPQISSGDDHGGINASSRAGGTTSWSNPQESASRSGRQRKKRAG